MKEKYYKEIKFYEIENNKKPLVLIHAQGVDALSFKNVAKKLSNEFHIYSVDCFGHGGSLHEPEKYNIKDIGDAILDFIKNAIGEPLYLLGHSSGGLIAAYIAAESDLVERLILEDPPLFSCQGERRKNTFNYVDLSTICHKYALENDKSDFVLYYFENQYAWNFFPEKSREKTKQKIVGMAKKYRKKHPHKDLKVPFWPKNALAGFQGMNNYDYRFGKAFYNDTFHAEITHEQILSKIKCKTVFMKAKTEISPDGILMAALNDEDTERAASLIGDCEILRFNCGHGIHIEKPKMFVNAIREIQ